MLMMMGRTKHSNSGSNNKPAKEGEKEERARAIECEFDQFLNIRARMCMRVSDMLQMYDFSLASFDEIETIFNFPKGISMICIDVDADKPGIYLISESICLSTYQCGCVRLHVNVAERLIRAVKNSRHI